MDYILMVPMPYRNILVMGVVMLSAYLMHRVMLKILDILDRYISVTIQD